MFYGVSEGLIALCLLVVTLLVAEGAFRAGVSRRSGADETDQSLVSALQGALLGLLALMLGFTFSMSVSRYDARKELVLAEATSLGTTYLRAGLLAEPHRSTMQGLLREYTAARLAFYDAGTDRARLDEVNAATGKLQDRIWAAAKAAADASPQSIPTGLLIHSLNDTLDMSEKRLSALSNHVPDVVVVLVLLVAVVSFGFIGYGCGLTGRRHIVMTTVVAMLVAFVVAVILDLDRPRRGLVTIGQDAMLRTAQSMGGVTR